MKLGLWYVHKRVQGGESDFDDALNCRVDIYRHTSFYNGKDHPAKGEVGPEWSETSEALRQILERRIDDPSTAQLEEEGLAYLWPTLEGRLRRTPQVLPSLEERPYGCWRFDTRNSAIGIHIQNVYQPKSPLSELFIPFAAALIGLLNDACATHPECGLVRCGSWLNSVPTFQALFPAEWTQSAVYRDLIGHSNGHWGQFIDRSGNFHDRNGARLRETGMLPYASSVCECLIDDAVAHLEATFPEALEYNNSRSPNQP